MFQCPKCGHLIYQPTRSNEQNRYYWGVVVPMLSEDIGYSKEEMHEILASKFLSRDMNVLGEVVRVVRSTASLNTVEFTEYVENCVRFGAEQGINIPQPNEEA